MVQIAIRCHPRVPVPSDELEHWLKRELDHLRDEVPQATVRFSSLTQHLPRADVEIGWQPSHVVDAGCGAGGGME